MAVASLFASVVHGHPQAALEHLESIIYDPWEKRREEDDETRGEGDAKAKEGEPMVGTGDGSAGTETAADGTI